MLPTKKKSIVLVILAGLMFSINLNAQQPAKEGGGKKAGKQVSKKAAQNNVSRVTIVFAGLMFFRQYEADRYFNVGILGTAIDHDFKIHDAAGQNRTPPSTVTNMEFEVTNQGTQQTRRGADRYIVAGDDYRTNPKHDREDYRYIVNFDDLYPQIRGGYDIELAALTPNIIVRLGRVYTLCRTEFLTSKMGLDGTPQDFGFMADVMAVDIDLQQNEKLELKNSAAMQGPPILSVAHDQQGTQQYVLISNIPPQRAVSHASRKLTHFQNYYLFIPKRVTQRFDFDFKNGMPTKRCPLPFSLESYFRKVQLSPPPYFCGTGGGNNGRPIQ